MGLMPLADDFDDFDGLPGRRPMVPEGACPLALAVTVARLPEAFLIRPPRAVAPVLENRPRASRGCRLAPPLAIHLPPVP